MRVTGSWAGLGWIKSHSGTASPAPGWPWALPGMGALEEAPSLNGEVKVQDSGLTWEPDSAATAEIRVLTRETLESVLSPEQGWLGVQLARV